MKTKMENDIATGGYSMRKAAGSSRLRTRTGGSSQMPRMVWAYSIQPCQQSKSKAKKSKSINIIIIVLLLYDYIIIILLLLYHYCYNIIT